MSLRGALIALAATCFGVWQIFGAAVFRVRYPMLGANPDAFGTLWMFEWVRDELAAGRFPRKTDRMFYPEGMDFLVLNGANILDAVLSVPLQMLLGGGRGEMWMSVLIAVGNAVSFFPLARSVAPKAPFAAGIATFWFATCPFILGELGGGRPTQAMLWFVPPAVGALMRMQGWRDAVALGICVGLQGLTYWYLPLFFTMVMAPVAVGRVVREPEVLRYFAVAVGIAVLLVAPLAVPILMAAREGSIPGLDVELAAAGVMLESTERSRRVISTFGLVSTMVPLLAVASRWRTAPGLTIGVALGCLFALGPRVSFAGMQLENHLYIWLYEHSSLVARLNFPARILSVVYCVAALSLTSVLASSVTRVVPALFAFLMVIEPRANKLAPVRSLALPPLPAAAIVKGRPGPILSVPMGAPEVAMAQQTFHQQPMVSGMADHVSTVRGPGYDTWLENRFFAELVQADDRMRPHTRAEEAEVREAMRWVWFDRALLARGLNSPLTEAIESRLRMALGDPYYEDDYTVLWDLSDPDARVSEAETAMIVPMEAEVEAERLRARGGQWGGVVWSLGDPDGATDSELALLEEAEDAKKTEAEGAPEAKPSVDDGSTEPQPADSAASTEPQPTEPAGVAPAPAE